MNEETLFQLALSLPPGDRPAFLDRECGGDVALRARVEALLAADADPHSPLDITAARPSATTLTSADNDPTRDPDGTHDRPNPAEAAGQVVAGRYKLLQRIGEGGMGEVWMAEQTEPVRRRVAVKLIRAERGSSKTILARFEAERQAIALMDHPHIAKLLDAGTTDAGRPFFVMELVKGVPLTDFCDQHKFGIPDRLALFTHICSAVQHAHQKGIIHRDLKPTNVLVESHDGKPVPKVIDFGLAKATTGLQLTEHTLYTGFGSVLGTPTYMAPEQATFNAVDVDTRADIYALGVILYELLTGTTPLTRDTVKKAALEEILRLIREEEAPTPSSRLSSSDAAPSVAANRQTEPARLGRLVKGELDWIVMKALAKERDRRYESANGFAKDVERFLNHEPVTAGPLSRWYQVRKFVRRNRTQAAAAGLVLLALLLGIAGTTFGLIRAEEKRQDADHAREREKKRGDGEEEAKDAAVRAAAAEKGAKEKEAGERRYAQGIAEFVIRDFLALTSVEGQDRFGGEGLDRNATLLDLLNRAAGKLRGRKDLDPRTEAELCWIVGVNYRGVGEAAKGVPFLERAVDLRRRVLGDGHEDTWDAITSLGVSYRANGQSDKALSLFEEVFRGRKAKFGPDHTDTLSSMTNVAIGLKDTGQRDKALPLFEEALRQAKENLGPEDPTTIYVIHHLALMHLEAGDLKRGLPMAEESLRLHKARFGPSHSSTLEAMNLLGGGYWKTKRLDRSIPLYEELLALSEKKLGRAHRDTQLVVVNLGVNYKAADRLTEAVPLLEEALAFQKAHPDLTDPDALDLPRDLAGVYTKLGRHDKAIPLLEEVLRVQTAALGVDDEKTLIALNNLAWICWKAKRLERSVPLFEELLTRAEKRFGRTHSNTQLAVGNLGVNYSDSGRPAEAIPLLEEAYRESKKRPGLHYPGPYLLDAYVRAGKPAEAAGLIAELLAESRKEMPKGSPELAAILTRCGLALLALKRHDEAEPLLREATGIREKKQPDAWTTFNTRSALGEALLGQKKYADAEPLLLNGYEGMKEREKAIPKEADTRIPEALDRLVALYTATGKPDEAKKYKELRGKYREVLPPPRADK